jgi:hypothetical protein
MSVGQRSIVPIGRFVRSTIVGGRALSKSGPSGDKCAN